MILLIFLLLCLISFTVLVYLVEKKKAPNKIQLIFDNKNSYELLEIVFLFVSNIFLLWTIYYFKDFVQVILDVLGKGLSWFFKFITK